MHGHGHGDHGGMEGHAGHMGHSMDHQPLMGANPSTVIDAHASVGHDMNDMGHMDHMMSMSFHFGNNETVLFDFWKFTTTSGLIGSMLGIFIMAALYEGLKYYREYLFWRTYNALHYKSVQTPGDKSPVASDDNRVIQPSMLSGNHFLQTILHIIQIVVSYLLMLIFMTYNVWLCIAVVLGAATGYFLFGWKKSVIVDVTEHCH